MYTVVMLSTQPAPYPSRPSSSPLEECGLVADVQQGVAADDDVKGTFRKVSLAAVGHLKGHLVAIAGGSRALQRSQDHVDCRHCVAEGRGGARWGKEEGDAEVWWLVGGLCIREREVQQAGKHARTRGAGTHLRGRFRRRSSQKCGPCNAPRLQATADEQDERQA